MPNRATAGYGHDFPFDNYQQMTDMVRSVQGKMIISINYHAEIREVFQDLNTSQFRPFGFAAAYRVSNGNCLGV